MKALLLIAHGSRRAASNDEVSALASKLKITCAQQYPILQAGFLELTTPSMTTAIERCIQEGATSITVLPYFLNSGVHVIKDIPDGVQQAQIRFPNVEIKIAAHIGASALMMPLLADAANAMN